MSVEFRGKKFKVKKVDKTNFQLLLKKKGIQNINDLKGLDQLTNLTSLVLDENEISEIQGLDNLMNPIRLIW